MVRTVQTFLLVGVGLLAAGCGGSPLQVEGQVLLDGAPVDTGSISFEPADGNGRDFGGAITAGNYKASSPPGAAPGKMIVRIRASRKTGKQIPAGPPLPPGTMIDETFPVPAIYNERSTLTADLAAGQLNRADFALKSGRK